MKKKFIYFNLFIAVILIACNNNSNSEANRSSETIRDSANAKKNISQPVPEVDLWLNDSLLTDSTRQLITKLVSVSELTRTWIQYKYGAKLSAMLDSTKPTSTYQTTLIKVGVWQEKTIMQVEVRRYGRLLLGFAIGKNKLPARNPEWIGYDASDKSANLVDSFYTSITQSDSLAVINGNRVLAFFPKDLEFRSYTAVAAKKIKDTATLEKLKDSLLKEKVTTDELKKLIEDVFKERNFDMIIPLGFVIAYRESFGRLVRKLK